MAAGVKDGVQGAMSRSAKQFGRRSASAGGGGGFVVGIATVVVVGVAGKLLSKLRKSSDSAHNNTITPNDSLSGIVNGEHPEMLMHLEDGNLPLHAAVINGKSVSSLDLSGHKITSATPDGEDNSDANIDFHTKTSPEDIDDKTCPRDLLRSDSVFITKQKEAKDEDDLSMASTALSELVNNALLDAKHDSPSKHELLNKTKALQEGIAGVISRAFKDFSYADLSGDELMPTKVQLPASWETNSRSGSEEETSPQDHPEDLFAEEELLLPSSTSTEAHEQVMERIDQDAPANQDEEVPTETLRLSSPPLEELEEPTGTIARNEIEGEPLHEEAGSSLAGNEVIVTEVEKERIEPEGLDVSLKDHIKAIASLLDDITTPALTPKGSRNDDETIKKERTPQEGQADNEAEIFTLNSILLRSKEGSAEVTAAKVLDAVQISTQIAVKEEGTPVTVTSLIVPATPHEISHTTKIMAKDSSVASGIRKTAIVTTVDFISSTAGGLKRELEENWPGPNRSSLEILGLALIVALIAVLFWLVQVRGNTSMPRS